MALLRPSEPPNRLQRGLNTVVPLLLAAAGIGLGVWNAIECAAVRFGYIADYSYAGAFYFAIFLGAGGLLLTVYWRTRWVGVGLFAAGILSYATFLGGMSLLQKMDRVAWRHEPPLISVGPNEKASAVIYFRYGVTADQISNFEAYVLERPAQIPPG